jgi:hypothetical protein
MLCVAFVCVSEWKFSSAQLSVRSEFGFLPTMRLSGEGEEKKCFEMVKYAKSGEVESFNSDIPLRLDATRR